MAQASSNTKLQAHALIERLAPNQLSAVVELLQTMLDPVSRAIANAPVDDEPETEQENQAVAQSKAWFDQRGGQGIPQEDVLTDFGFSVEDLKKRNEPE